MKRFNIQNLVRTNIFEMQAYTSARDEFEGEGSVFLDANENALGSAVSGDFNRYPDPRQWLLKTNIARIKKVQPEQIFLGNGSDEAIDLLFRAFCEPQKDRALIFPPTYGMYKVQATINNTPVDEINLDANFDVPIDSIEQIINPMVKLMFICSPNNPTGNLISKDYIIRICKGFKGLVVVDEAYIDFAPDEASMVSEINNYPNLIVLQTFSKAWGMAALRLGMAFAQKETIAILNKIKYPYNVNIVSQEYGIKAIENSDRKKAMVDELLVLRKNLTDALNALAGVEKVYKSDANFVLVKVGDARFIYKQLIKNGIVVRNRSSVALCQNCLRITVGTEAENKALIKMLSEIVASMPQKTQA